MIRIRHKGIDLDWYGWCYLCKKDEYIPLKLSYNKTIGWWIWLDENRLGNLKKLCQNDGLNNDDFLAWFQYPKPFDGQIICWNDKIEY